MEFFATVMICVGLWTIVWTILALFTPTRARRMHSSIWDQLGALADRLGIQLKNERDE